MPRVPKVWWRETHNAYYAKINGKQTRLSADYKEAQKLFHQLRGQPAKTVSLDNVYAVLDEFLEWSKHNQPEKTYVWYKAMLTYFTQHFRPQSPNMKVEELRPIDVSRWLSTTSYKNSTKSGVIAALKRAFNWAANAEGGGLIDRNPLAGLKKPEAGRREDFLTQAQFDELLKLVPDDEFRDLLNVLWLTGTRPREVLRMEARHVYGDHVVYAKEESKGGKRQRVIFLPPAAREIVSRLAAKNPQGPIFRNTDGKAWTNYATNNRFARLKDEKKLGRKVCAYLLRHGFAHRALTGAKLSPETVATLMGHADTTMVYKVYGHLGANHPFMLEAAAAAATGAGVAPSSASAAKKTKKKR